jgi:hypothetical protein
MVSLPAEAGEEHSRSQRRRLTLGSPRNEAELPSLHIVDSLLDLRD